MRFLLFVAAVALSMPAARSQDWQPVTAALLQKEKPGFGGLCGVAVDHATGDVYVNVSDRGTFRSTDQGRTWERFGKEPFKGRTETAGCLQLDPTGKTKRLVMATVYGGPVLQTRTDAGDWRPFDKASVHVDWCAVDWTGPEFTFVLALKHESGGLLLRSRDGGKTFDNLGKGHGPAWVFDANTAVVAREKTRENPKPGLHRTTDAGATFQKVSDYSPVSLPRWHGDALYWLADGALIKTADRGKTWEKLCDLKDGRFGPVFGTDAKRMFVLTGAGVIESADGGATWAKPIALPREIKGVTPLTWLDYDPFHDTLYVMKMGTELCKLARGK